MSFNYNPEDPRYYDSLKEPVVQPKAKLTTQERVQQFYETREKAPVIDQAKVDRLKRMGRINQVGQGVKVLGDILTTGLGANVKRRQPDQTAPALYQSYQNMLDRYEAQKDAFNYRDFQTKRDNVRFGIGRADKDTATEFANRRQTAAEKQALLKYNADWAKYVAGMSQKEREQAERERHNIAMEKRPVGGSINKTNQPKKVQTKNAVYEMSPAEYSLRRERALKNSALLKTRFGNMFIDAPKLNKYKKAIPGQFVTSLNPEITEDDLVRADLEFEEQNKKTEAGAKSEEQHGAGSKVMLTNPGMTNTPSTPTRPVQNTAQKAQSKIDYSKLVY